MGMLLAYELEKGTERELKDLAAALGHQVKMEGKLGSEMLVFCGLDREAMDLLLAGLRERKLQIPLKAVITPHNIQWTSRMLYQELKKEHETMAAMKKSPL